MLSIVGRNGAGKSTISKLICGFYKPTSGQIIFNGKDIVNNSIKERSEKIGFCNAKSKSDDIEKYGI